MTRDQWARVRELFGRALDLDDRDRAALLRDCEDEELRRVVVRLLANAKSDNSFLDRPQFRLISSAADGPPLLQPGDLVAGRFRIVRPLGRGGMGEVYEADDTTLGEHVALKVMRPIGDLPAEALAERFRREVQLARKVSHAGVCRVHDVAFHTSGSGTALIVLTMELLRGQTLAELLETRTLKSSDALGIARQITDALGAAHAGRVIHGDVKPGNVIVEFTDSGPRAVLTDFGLAHVAGDEHAGAMGALGTRRYMAPEQLRGEPPTARSDLYALALVLDRLLENHPDTRWPKARSRALHGDPSARFATATELRNAFSPRVPLTKRLWGDLTVRQRLNASLLATAVALGALFWRMYTQAVPVIAAASQVLLAHTLNETGLAQFDGATEVLRSQLAQSAHFQLLSDDRVSAQLRQMRREPSMPVPPAVAREVALRENVPVVIHSRLFRRGGRFALDVTLEAVHGRPSLVRDTWSHEFAALDSVSMFGALREAANWVRQSIGEAPADLADQDRPPAETTTSSWDALRLLARANDEQRAGRTQEAVLLLEQSVRLDPDFATAHMRRGDFLISLRREREGYEAWQRAIAISEQRQLTTREQLRIRGQFYQETGQLGAAEKAYRTYLVLYPTDAEAAVWLGTVLNALDNAPEAATWLERAAAMRPDWYVPVVHLVTTWIDLGRVDKAQQQIDWLRRAGRDDWARWLTALLQFLAGDVDAAVSTIEPLRTSDDKQWRSREASLRAAWRTEQGRYADAIAAIEAGLEFDAAQGLRDREADKWLSLADLRRRANQSRSSVASAVSRALALEHTSSQLARGGSILAACGEIVEARRLLAQMDGQPNLPRFTLARKELAGHIALAAGDARSAVQHFEDVASVQSSHRPRWPLALALIRSGQTPRAIQVLEGEVEHLIRRYRAPDPQVLGLWSDSLSALIGLLAKADAPRATRYRSELLRLRPDTAREGR